MRSRWAPCILLFLAAGCEKTKETPPPTPTPVPTKRDCTAKVAELATWMKAVRDEGESLIVRQGLQLMAVNRPATPSPHLRQVIVDDDGISFVGVHGPDSFVDLGRAVQARRKADADRGLGLAQDELLVLIDEKAAWQFVARVAAISRSAGYRRLHFVLEGKSRVVPPPHSSITQESEELSNFDPSSEARAIPEKSVPFEEGLGRIYSSCEPAVALHKSLADLSASDRADAIVVGIPKAIESCECNIEIAAVQTLHWFRFRRFENPATTTITIDLGDDKAQLIRHPAATPWSEAYRSLADLEYPVKLGADL